MATHQLAGGWAKTGGGGTTFSGSLDVTLAGGAFSGNEFFSTPSNNWSAVPDDYSGLTITGTTNKTGVLQGYILRDNSYLGFAVFTAFKPGIGNCTVQLTIYDCDQITGDVLTTKLYDSGAAGVPENGMGTPTGLVVM